MIKRRIYGNSNAGTNINKAVAAKANSKINVSDTKGRMVETSSLGGLQNTGLQNTGMSNNVINIDLFPLLKGLVPDGYENFPLLNNLYRDIYYYDSVAGAAADLMSFMPFSDLTLGGVEAADVDKLSKFYESLDRINIHRLLPELSIDYLVLGTFIGSLVFNKERGVFTDVIPQDIDHISMTPLPFYSQDPIMKVSIAKETVAALGQSSKRVDRIKKKLGKDIVDKLTSGSFELDPLTTLYIPRKTLSSREGISWYKRILPIYLLEKNLFKGTLIESAKRQRSIMHISAGSTEWEPTIADLQFLTELFMNADADPIGAMVATRSDVNVNDIRQGGDFWNITNVWSDTVPAKLRALGISEGFLSSDSNYSEAQNSMTVFIEWLASFRYMIERKVFYDKLFPLISVVNGYYKSEADKKKWKNEDMDPEDILYELQDNSALMIPKIHWHKQLKAEGDSDYLGMLNTLAENGVPVTLRSMAAAGNLSLDQLLAEMEDDLKIRKQIADLKAKLEGGAEEEEGGGGYEEGYGEESSSSSSIIGNTFTTLQTVSKDNPYISGTLSKNKVKHGRGLVKLLDRDYGVDSEIKGKTKTGKDKYIVNQHLAHKKINELIAKAARERSENNPKKKKSIFPTIKLR
jgi:hypothetical protein